MSKEAQNIVQFVLEGDEDFKPVEMTPEPDPYALWWDIYKPIPNPNADDDSFDGTKFETYGADLEAVRKADRHNVWTLVQGDNDSLVICADFHYVNRECYFITERPWTDCTDSYVIKDEEEPSEEEPQ